MNKLAVLCVCVLALLALGDALDLNRHYARKRRAGGTNCPANAAQVFEGCWGKQRAAIVDLFKVPGETNKAKQEAFCAAYKYTGTNVDGEPAAGDGCAKRDDWWQIKFNKRNDANCAASANGVAWAKAPPAKNSPLMLGQKTHIVAYLKAKDPAFDNYDTTPPTAYHVLNVQPNDKDCYSHCVNLAYVLCGLRARLAGQDVATNQNKIIVVTDPATVDNVFYVTPTGKGCGATNNEICYLKNICPTKFATLAKDALWECDFDATKVA